MIAVLDIAKLFESPETIVTLVIAVLGVFSTLLTYLGKKTAAKAALEAQDAVKDKKKEIVELGDLITTLVKGVEKAKSVFRPVVEDSRKKDWVVPDKNVGAIIEEYADTIGMKDILNAKVKAITTITAGSPVYTTGNPKPIEPSKTDDDTAILPEPPK